MLDLGVMTLWWLSLWLHTPYDGNLQLLWMCHRHPWPSGPKLSSATSVFVLKDAASIRPFTPESYQEPGMSKRYSNGGDARRGAKGQSLAGAHWVLVVMGRNISRWWGGRKVWERQGRRELGAGITQWGRRWKSRKNLTVLARGSDGGRKPWASLSWAA